MTDIYGYEYRADELHDEYGPVPTSFYSELESLPERPTIGERMPRTMTAEREAIINQVLAGTEAGQQPLIELDAERAAHQETQAKLSAERALSKLRLDDCSELCGLVRGATAALDFIATFVPDSPQTHAETLEEVTDVADRAQVVLEKGIELFNNKPELATRALELAEAQAISRELLAHIEREKLYRSLLPAIIGDYDYTLRCAERDLTRKALSAEADELIAKAKAVLG